jgi:hypothetical protein
MNSVAGSSQQLGPNTAGDAATPIAAGTAWSASMANKTASTAHRVRSGRGKRELDTVELRKLAEEALADLRTPTSSPTEAQRQFVMACHPATVIALLDEIGRLRAKKDTLDV